MRKPPRALAYREVFDATTAQTSLTAAEVRLIVARLLSLMPPTLWVLRRLLRPTRMDGGDLRAETGAAHRRFSQPRRRSRLIDCRLTRKFRRAAAQ